ncbi:MAG: lytic transglycosylase domain-containing protein, partial [Pseudomonadota bacterium]
MRASPGQSPWVCRKPRYSGQSASPARSRSQLFDALVAVEAGDWVTAGLLAERSEDPVAASIVTWLRLRAGEADWPEYRGFLQTHGDWPGLAR